MEAQSPHRHSQVIEISGGAASSNKICGEAACGFSKDSEERSASMRKLFIAVLLCVIFMSVEVVGGIKANSLAILTDAAHLLSDVAAFAISLFSLWASGWEANPRQSYGFFRIEILGALLSIQLIWLLAGILVYEAIQRIISGTRDVNGFLMFLVAAFGLVVNIIMALLLGHSHSHGHSTDHDHTEEFHHAEDDDDDDEDAATRAFLGESKNVNVQGAYLHVVGDSVQSVGVMIGGAIIWWKPEWHIVDLICTLIFSVIVLGTTVNMLRNILEVLMESTPREIDAAEIQRGLLEMEEVVAVHELHVWAITVGKVLMACHVIVRPEVNADMVLDKLFGEHLEVSCLEQGFVDKESNFKLNEDEEHTLISSLEGNMPFLQMLQSVDYSPPFFPFKDPNFQALLRPQHLKKPWEGMPYIPTLESEMNELEQHTESQPKDSSRLSKHDDQERVRKRKRGKESKEKDKEEVENQRMTHIAVERNRRRQMNEHLTVLKSLMHPSYIQKGDHASIIGGAIDFVKELEQLVESLEAQRRMRNKEEEDGGMKSSSSVSSSGGNEAMKAERWSKVGGIEVSVIQRHVNLRIQCERRAGLLINAIVALENLRLNILHLNITSSDSSVLYSFSLKIEEDSKLGSANEIAEAVDKTLSFIN
ncbi:Metal tolerance protein 1 [Stylosanthes scabra]|uniref:Metal tolerance protein 1 n=1 Tax=Stylosanthes scabra TaxID=79078 RepID=A0ABU6UBL2_9FABA|nr:Metal tolerance protein 1 [Stylosanthes scabra]